MEPLYFFQVSYLDKKEVQHMKKSGAAGVFEKPMTPQELKNILKSAEFRPHQDEQD
jgi:hypothetical protein